MNLIAAPARIGPWVDASVPLSRAAIKAVKAAGKVGIFRYVSLPGNDPSQDISAAELEAICGEGLDCILVQHVRAGSNGKGWDPAKHDGSVDAEAAADHGARVGYPSGCHLCVDLEDISGTAEATATFAAGWAATTCARAYLAADYIGYAVPLNAQEFYDLPDFTIGWSDFGSRHIATRGFAIVQHAPEIVIAGTRFDPDDVRPDLLGNLPMACRMGSALAAA